MTTLSKMKISKEQQIQLVRLIKKLLGMGNYSSEIKQVVVQEYGLSTRSVERYITRARREMVQRTNVSFAEHRAEAYYCYRGILNNPNVTLREQLRARERIDKLFGLDSPAHIHRQSILNNLTAKQLQAMSDEEFEKTYQLVMN